MELNSRPWAVVISRVVGVTGLLWALVAAPPATGQQPSHEHHASPDGFVMNANATELSRDCDAIAAEYELTVYAGTQYAEAHPGLTFGMSDHEYRVEPCSRVTVTFINQDEVRHQWMVHGLPSYLYPGGMFHIEASGGHRQTGTFIVPGDDRTYLVHCDMAQHMEKGMKAQLVVGAGSGDLPSIPGVSANFEKDSYVPGSAGWWVLGSIMVGFMVGWIGLRWGR